MVENTDYAGFVRRTLKAFVKRASDDPEALVLLKNVADEAADALNRAIVGCSDSGYSYGEIASRLGITRQAVQQRIERQRDLDARRDVGPDA